MKTFFDCIFIDCNDEQNECEYSIKLEYYKTAETEENVKVKYGIKIVKTEFLNGEVNVESKTINNLADSSEEIERLIEILKNNEVTPIGIEDVIDEFAIV